MKQGIDKSSPCPNCLQKVWISQIAKQYTTAERMYWLTSGLCKTCQQKDAG